jgi:hypothetical protein
MVEKHTDKKSPEPETHFKSRKEWNKQFWDQGNKWSVENAKTVGNY